MRIWGIYISRGKYITNYQKNNDILYWYKN